MNSKVYRPIIITSEGYVYPTQNKLFTIKSHAERYVQLSDIMNFMEEKYSIEEFEIYDCSFHQIEKLVNRDKQKAALSKLTPEEQKILGLS